MAVKEFVENLQRRLSAVKLYSGKIDGIPGDGTNKGIDALFAAYGVPAAPAPVTAGGKVVGPLASEWLPVVKMSRIIAHWTAGSYTPSSLDKEHYHFLWDGNGNVHRGLHSIAGNVKIKEGQYAAHTLNCNTGSIGVSLCCMAGAQEQPFKAGPCPMTEVQWMGMVHGIAQLCKFYGIPVTDKTVLSHAEVQPNLGITQRGKWDYTRLAFAPYVVGYKPCGDKLRADVKAVLVRM